MNDTILAACIVATFAQLEDRPHFPLPAKIYECFRLYDHVMEQYAERTADRAPEPTP